MAEDKLQKELLDIQEKLGGTREVPPEGTVDKLQWHLDKLEELAGGGGSGISDVKVGDSSVVEDGVATLLTKTAYNPETNKLVTESDVTAGVADVKVDDVSIVSGGEVNLKTKTAYNAETNKLATESDIPSGGSVYMHKLTFTSSEDQHVIVYSSSSTPFTSSTWYWWLRNNGFTNKTNCLPFISNDGQISKTTTKVAINSGIFASANSPYCTRFETNINITPGTGIDSITYTETGTQPNRDIVIEM